MAAPMEREEEKKIDMKMSALFSGLAGLQGLSAFAKGMTTNAKNESPKLSDSPKSLKHTSEELYEETLCGGSASKKQKVEQHSEEIVEGMDKSPEIQHSETELSPKKNYKIAKAKMDVDCSIKMEGVKGTIQKEEKEDKDDDAEEEDDDEILAVYGLSNKVIKDEKHKMDLIEVKEKAEAERLRAEEERIKQEEICKKEAVERAKREKEKAKEHFKIIQYMFKSGARLKSKAVVIASAATLYHKFFEVYDTDDYDPYLIGTTVLYLGHRIEEESVKVRDVINVCHRTLHPDEPPLDMGPEYLALRESVLTCELFMLRVLNFKVTFNHPHRYMLHYLKALYNWFSPRITDHVPIAQTAWTILSDCYHGKVCMRYDPAEMATSVIYFATQCHGIEVPYTHEGQRHWYQVFCENITLLKIRKIICEILEIYDLEDRKEEPS